MDGWMMERVRRGRFARGGGAARCAVVGEAVVGCAGGRSGVATKDRRSFGESGTAALDRRCRQHDESADKKKVWEQEAFGWCCRERGDPRSGLVSKHRLQERSLAAVRLRL